MNECRGGDHEGTEALLGGGGGKGRGSEEKPCLNQRHPCLGSSVPEERWQVRRCT